MFPIPGVNNVVEDVNLQLTNKENGMDPYSGRVFSAEEIEVLNKALRPIVPRPDVMEVLVPVSEETQRENEKKAKQDLDKMRADFVKTREKT